MVLIVFFSVRNSPFTSTSIFFDRSPLATAVVTSAILRTWSVSLPAIELTESVRSFQVPATPFTLAWPPSLPSVPTSRATRVTSAEKLPSCSTILLMVRAVRKNSPSRLAAFDFQRHALGHVALRHRADDARDLAGRVHQIVDQGIDRLDSLAPEAALFGQNRALLELAFLADHLTQPGQLVGHGRVLFHQVVEDLGHLAVNAGPVERHSHAGVAASQLGQRHEQGREFTVVHGNRRVVEDFHGALLHKAKERAGHDFCPVSGARLSGACAVGRRTNPTRRVGRYRRAGAKIGQRPTNGRKTKGRRWS